MKTIDKSSLNEIDQINGGDIVIANAGGCFYLGCVTIFDKGYFIVMTGANYVDPTTTPITNHIEPTNFY